jgi:DNA-binding GntR family transcriptional regulator
MSLQKKIYHQLKDKIIYGELKPGEKLSEIELAKSLMTSRTPIREAFRQLQTEGYITVFPNRGAFVSKLPPKEIEEIYNLISLLEGYAAELAAVKANDLALGEMKKLQKRLVVDAAKKRYLDYVKGNTIFHGLITKLSGNNSLVNTTAELRARVYRYRLTSVTIPGYLEQYVIDHEKIIDSITKKDPVRARKFMTKHVDFVKKVLIKYLNENPWF